MGIKKYKPTSPGRRQMSVSDFSELTRSTPEKSLTEGLKSTGGRNNMGRITTRFRGGGAKRRYRIIDFRRDKDDVAAQVMHIEYDPNRSARIALLEYADGEKRYILAPVGLKQGDTVRSGSEAEFKVGHAMMLKDIPDGLSVHCIEMHPGRGAVLARAAGQQATVRAKEGDYVQIKLPSGEIRQLHATCRATIGQIGNLEHSGVNRAGWQKRYLGRRPHVRGVVMNRLTIRWAAAKAAPAAAPPVPWGQHWPPAHSQSKSV